MKKILSIFFLALLCNVAFSQADTTAIFQKADSLITIGDTFYDAKKYNEAFELYSQASEIAKVVNEGDNARYVTSLNKIGVVYLEKGNYQDAMEYFIHSLKLVKKIFGEEHIKYASLLNNIGIAYYYMGNYQMASEYYLQAIEIFKKVLDEGHPDYATSINNIGSMYSAIGDYTNAMKYKTQALEIRERTVGKEHPFYAETLNDIGNIYLNMGDYQNAIKYHTQGLEVLKNTIGDKHPTYANSMDNIGNVYYDMGDYQNALKYYSQAMEIRKNTFGENSLEYANSLNNTGNTYLYTEEYQIALEYNIQAMEIYKKNLGDEHIEYAKSLNNIGVIYNDLGDFENALKYHLQALEILKKVLGEEHIEYANSLNNIGTVYFYIGDNQKALEYIKQSIEVKKKVLGKEHPNYANSLYNTGVIYYFMGDFQNGIKANKAATDIYKNDLIRNFSFLTTNEREAYWNTKSILFSSIFDYLFYAPNDTLATKTSYNTELITKGLLLASEISIANIIMESGNSTLISEYETMKSMLLKLNKELETPIAERIYNCDSLENEIQKKERYVMENCKEFGDVTHFIKIDWKDVQKSLKSNDVAIEFSNFTDNDDTTRYVALVLTKNMEAPVCVQLFTKNDIGKMLRGIAPAKLESPTDDENRGATTVAAKKLGIYESVNLYNALWKPLEKYFPENPRIFFAPSGDLHQIAVEYAPTGNGKTISDKYEIYRVSSTRFLAMDYMPKPLKNSVLYGGIYYDSDTTTMKQESDRYSTRSATSYTSFADFNRNEDRGSLNYLPGTKTEVEDIVGKLKKKRIKSQLYEGSQANEESFKALSGSDISVLHIATHGFFLPTDEKMSGDQSLVQSGLLLSGANYAWQNKPLPDGIEDGILTAKEISFMDLRKTDLVVLSACQTALGEITGEGVFGLQRGFKKAGARTIIMSLWPVDDNATLLMMTEFYNNLTKGMTKREAFLAAQNKVKTTAGFENPRYWAAFIMLDGNEK